MNQNVQVPGEIDIVVCKQTSTPNNGLLTGYPNLRLELRYARKQSRKVGEELSMNSRIAKSQLAKTVAAKEKKLFVRYSQGLQIQNNIKTSMRTERVKNV